MPELKSRPPFIEDTLGRLLAETGMDPRTAATLGNRMGSILPDLGEPSAGLLLAASPFLISRFGNLASPGSKFAADVGISRQLASNDIGQVKFRLGQMLRDRASSKKAGVDVEGPQYTKPRIAIKILRAHLKELEKAQKSAK